MTYIALKNDGSDSFSTKFSQLLMAHASQVDTKTWVNGNACEGQNSKFQTFGTIVTFAN